MADESIEVKITSEPKPRPPGPRPPRKPAKRTGQPEQDTDVYFKTARQLVVANYNAARDPSHAPELTVEGVIIEHFAKTLQNWMAIATSPIARRLMWVITCNQWKNEAYINVYQKLTNTSVSLGKPANS